MGRYKKGTDPNVIERERRVQRTFSIPTYIATELAVCKNPSAIITSLLEENLHRLGNMGLQDAAKIREEQIKRIIKEKLTESFEESYNEFKPKFASATEEILSIYGYRIKIDSGTSD